MLKCVLLDANIIIEAYELGIWEKLIEKVEISISSIVAHTEALFYDSKKGRVTINLNNMISDGKIKEYSASTDDMIEFYNLFDRVFIDGIHEGEAECLALILKRKVQDTLFCSSDAVAIQALAMIDRSDAGISFELLLKKVGLQKKLKIQFTEKFFKKYLKQGTQNRITQTGIKRKK